MQIGLGLSITAQLRFGSSLSSYAVNDFDPSLVFDFTKDYFRTAGTDTTFDSAITHAATTNATMVDSDGLLKWRPHNLVQYSSITNNWGRSGCTITPNSGLDSYGNTTLGLVTGTGGATTQIRANMGTTEALGVSHTVEFEFRPVDCDFAVVSHSDGVSGLFVYFDTGTGSVTSATSGTNGDLWTLISSELVLISTGLWRCKFEYSQTKDTTPMHYVYLSDRASTIPASGPYSGYIGNYRAYRSDLGGMVNNPDRGDSYVPTTSSAVYLPRVGHHIYNGNAWVNEGVLHESEARTNLVTYSNDFSQWSVPAMATGGQANSLTGESDATLLETTGGINKTNLAVSSISNLQVTMSVIAKAGTVDWLLFFDNDYGGSGAWFDLASGALGTVQTNASANIEDLGGGWRRCSITFQNASTYTPSPLIEVVSANGDSGATNGENIYIYGVQFEVGSTPSSYIPTSGSTVTRAAETLTVPAANMPWPTLVYTSGELVTNGTFDTDVSGWSGLTWLAGGTAEGILGDQTLVTTVGGLYKVTFDYLSNTGPSNALIRITNGTTNAILKDLIIAIAGPYTTYEMFFVATSTDTIITLRSLGNSTVEWDNISVKEMNPLSVSIQMDGKVTGENLTPIRWLEDANNAILLETGTNNFTFTQEASSTVDTVTGGSFTSGTFVTFNTSSRHGSTFINGAVDGTALTANTTPVALPDLSTTDLKLGYDFMGTIGKFRVWSDDLTDTGIEEAST